MPQTLPSSLRQFQEFNSAIDLSFPEDDIDIDFLFAESLNDVRGARQARNENSLQNRLGKKAGKKLREKLLGKESDGLGEVTAAEGVGVGSTLSSLAASEGVTGVSALAPSSQLGTLPSISEFASSGVGGVSGGTSSAGLSTGMNVGIGATGLALGAQGIEKGNVEKGALGSAMAGFSVGGPIGGVIGGVIGGIGSYLRKDKSDLGDRIENRLEAVAGGDYNQENLTELSGLLEKQATSIGDVSKELSGNIRTFRDDLLSIGTDDFDQESFQDSGSDLLDNYLGLLESGKIDFDTDANRYARSVLMSMESLDSESSEIDEYKKRLKELNER